MHRPLSVGIGRLRSSALRRVLALVLGAVGVLALSGSQALNLAVAASGPTAPSAEQGSVTVISPTVPAFPVPTPYPTASLGLLPSGAPTPTGPYGLSSASALTASGIPEAAYRAYVAAAAELARTDPECAISWTLIAGIGRVESNHGRYGGSSINADGLVTPPILGIRLDGTRAGTARISDSDGGRYDGDTSFDRAVGPMQFLPGTWKTYGAGANPQNMNAAALAAARYLCAGSGSLATQEGRWAAVYRYNHSDSYVSLVLSLADSYANGKTAPFPTRPSGTTPPPITEPPATPPGPPPSVPSPPPTTTPPTATPTGTPTASPTGTPPVTPTGWPNPRPTSTTTAPTPTTVPPTTTTDPPTTTTDPPTTTTEPPTTTTTDPPTTTTTEPPSPTQSPTDEACPETPGTPTPTPTPSSTCPEVVTTPTSAEP